jgi:hypothetical protein
MMGLMYFSNDMYKSGPILLSLFLQLLSVCDDLWVLTNKFKILMWLSTVHKGIQHIFCGCKQQCISVKSDEGKIYNQNESENSRIHSIPITAAIAVIHCLAQYKRCQTNLKV